jgi:hypothetical protein
MKLLCFGESVEQCSQSQDPFQFVNNHLQQFGMMNNNEIQQYLLVLKLCFNDKAIQNKPFTFGAMEGMMIRNCEEHSIQLDEHFRVPFQALQFLKERKLKKEEVQKREQRRLEQQKHQHDPKEQQEQSTANFTNLKKSIASEPS